MKNKFYPSIAKAIEAVTKIEQAEEGYLEKASNYQLDSKTANAGYNEYTKYWRDMNLLGLIGVKGFAGGSNWYWCAGFQSWSFIQAFGVELARKLLLHLPFISCATMGEKAKAAKKLYTAPKVGDVVLFWNGSRFYHTGFVYKVSTTMFYTVEGNTNSSKDVVPNGGSVRMKSYYIADHKKKGTRFFRPDYSITVKKEPKPLNIKMTINTNKNPLMCRKGTGKETLALGKFAKGSTVTVLEKTKPAWYKVKGKDMITGKTITGYCASKYLK